jgi:hypothetical protein
MTLTLTCARCTRTPSLSINGRTLCAACAHAEIDRASPPRPKTPPAVWRVLEREGRRARARFDALPHGRAFFDALVASAT